MLAIILVVAGVLTIFGVWIIATDQKPAPLVIDRCGILSPDGKYSCSQHMAHYGWCRSGNLEWRSDAWAIGYDDYTRQTPNEYVPTLVAPVKQRRKRLPRQLFWLGIIAIVWTAWNVADAATPKPPPPTHRTCNWDGLKCHWS